MLVLNRQFSFDRIWTSVVTGASLSKWVTNKTENARISRAYLSLKFTRLNCEVTLSLRERHSHIYTVTSLI